MGESHRDEDGDPQSGGHELGDPDSDDDQDSKPSRGCADELGGKREPNAIIDLDVTERQRESVRGTADGRDVTNAQLCKDWQGKSIADRELFTGRDTKSNATAIGLPF
jgi:hypothetical protein